MRKMSRYATIVLSCAVLILKVDSSQAAVLYSTSFESPEFGAGPLDGVGTWTASLSTTVQQVVSSPQTVGAESVDAFQGQAMVRSSPTFGNHNVGPNVGALWSGRPGGQNVLKASIRIYRPASDVNEFGRHVLWVYGPGGTTTIAAIFYRPSDGRLTLRRPTAPPGEQFEVSPGTVVPASSWSEFAIFADFNSNQSTFQFNGQTVFQSTFAATSVGFADLYSSLGSADFGGSISFTDNYAIESLSVVPEPVALVGLAMVGVALLARVKRHSCRASRAACIL